ncbi:MAG: serine/threonine protein kinase [Alphaproteobacteria bacterium]|nr:serine/threonine protein kinase [Alphaproteobacteria bacterium]MCB9699895.1 serine/threonine protein kinase [Alphaproteobacteria bacterium]
MVPDLQVIVSTHRLPPQVVRDLEALVANLQRGTSATVVLSGDAQEVPDLEPAPPGEASGASVDAIPARYTDMGRIGVGGMGEVRRVRDRELGRTCAYKSVKPELMDKVSVVARFVEEAQIGAQLQHPNIPPIYDGGRLSDGRPWFTMKEVQGETLGAVIRAAHGGPVTEVVLHHLVDVLVKVCDAVGYAHGRGVVHRDLKPDNVMVGSHGEAFVLDWGLAKVVGRPDRALEEGDLEPEVATGRSAAGGGRPRAAGARRDG